MRYHSIRESIISIGELPGPRTAPKSGDALGRFVVVVAVSVLVVVVGLSLSQLLGSLCLRHVSRDLLRSDDISGCSAVESDWRDLFDVGLPPERVVVEEPLLEG